MTKLITDEKIDELGGMIAREFLDLRTKFKEDISELRMELKQDMYQVQKDMKALFTAQGKRIMHLEKLNI